MTELSRHIGPDTDVPAGDIGVGGREIGYMFGQYKRLRNEFTGVLTGKKPAWGGSLIRPEATGYGATYFMAEMLALKDESIDGKTVVISGSGNVALHAAEKCMRLGGKVVALSDSKGSIYDPAGLTEEKLAWLKDLKEVRRGRHFGVRRGTRWGDFPRRTRPLGLAVRPGISLRHTERTGWSRSPNPRGKWLQSGSRGGQYALHT